jgi:hypothetical protein
MSPLKVFAVTRTVQEEVFEHLFEAHYDLSNRPAYSVTRRAEDAEDGVLVFLQVLRREFPPDLTKTPKGHVYRATVNLSLKAIRPQ